MSESTESKAPDPQGIEVSPVALESVAAARMLKKMAGNEADHKIAQWFLANLMKLLTKFLADQFDELMQKDEQLGMRLGLAVTVLGGYFDHRGDWDAVLKEFEELFADSHKGLPEQIATALKDGKTETFERYVRDHVAGKHTHRTAVAIIGGKPVAA